MHRKRFLVPMLIAATLGCLTLVSRTAEAAERRYKVSVDSVPAGATVYLEAREAGALGRTPHVFQLKPGRYTFILEADGYEALTRKVTVKKASSFTFTLTPKPVAAAPVPAAPVPTPVPAASGSGLEGSLIKGGERPTSSGADGPAHAILAYGKVGGLIPVSKLGPHVAFHVGGGYLLPVLRGRLAAVIDLGYSQSSTDKSLPDPRVGQTVAEASYSYTLTQRDLDLFLGPQFFILDPWRRLVPYAAAGLHLHFLQSVIAGQGGPSALGENSETSTKAGFALRGGLGWRLGPGLVTGELSFAWAPIDHQVTGESNLGRFSILVGYTGIFALQRRSR